jgi:hypothetical protein
MRVHASPDIAVTLHPRGLGVALDRQEFEAVCGLVAFQTCDMFAPRQGHGLVVGARRHNLGKRRTRFDLNRKRLAFAQSTRRHA